jgi:hypothetical protein
MDPMQVNRLNRLPPVLSSGPILRQITSTPESLADWRQDLYAGHHHKDERAPQMFGLFKRKKKPATALDEMIFAIYGNPPPEKRANVTQAVEIAMDLLAGEVDEKDISRQAIALNDGPVPYSTHDLGLAVAMSFFQKQENIPRMFQAQLMTRMKMLDWHGKGLVAPMLVQSFEGTLYRLYKPG